MSQIPPWRLQGDLPEQTYSITFNKGQKRGDGALWNPRLVTYIPARVLQTRTGRHARASTVCQWCAENMPSATSSVMQMRGTGRGEGERVRIRTADRRKTAEGWDTKKPRDGGGLGGKGRQAPRWPILVVYTGGVW